MKKTEINIAIFASGSGTNAQAIIEFFRAKEHVNIKCIYSNYADAFVLTRAKNEGIPTLTFTRNEFYKSNTVGNHLADEKIELIILAGFMWLIPAQLVDSYTILNIHPALLPNYGGKGMYGHFVHEAIIKNKETESGITIHYVNKEYDKGSIILQEKCKILPTDSADDLANKIHVLEHQYYPITISKVAEKLLS